MSGFYSDMAAVVDELIGEFGFDSEQVVVTLTYQDTEPYDTQDGTAEPDPDSVTITTLEISYPSGAIDGVRIQRDDKKLIVAPGSITRIPTIHDSVSYGGKVYQIIHPRPIAPAGVLVSLELQIRLVSGG